MLNLFLKRSTRPPVSTSFCFPVKNGWHLEQISTEIFSLVEAVSYAAPHAHLMVVFSYLGWIPSFTHITSHFTSIHAAVFGLNRKYLISYHNRRFNASIFTNIFERGVYKFF